MPITHKRGALSNEDQDYIRKNVHRMSLGAIATKLNRTVDTIEKYCAKYNLTHIEMEEESYEDTVLRRKLETRAYWPQIFQQFTDDEREYFCVTWISMMKQFNEDIKYSEELQVKQWITLDIMCNRILKDRKSAVEQLDRLQRAVDLEYDKDIDERNGALVQGLETEMAMIRNSMGQFTREHGVLLDKIKDIQRDLRAARSDRIKRVEDSNTSFAGFLVALEDEEFRAKVGENMGIMKLAKDAAKKEFGQYYKFGDGQIDRPLLTHETIEYGEDNE